MTANAGTVVVDCPCGNPMDVTVHLEPGITVDGVHHVPVTAAVDEAWQDHVSRFHGAV